MTKPAQTIKHMRSSYQRYQLLSIIFALLTIIASMIAALIGIHYNSLVKAKEKAALAAPPKIEVVPDPEVVKALEQTQRALETVQKQLTLEKQKAQKLEERADWLSRQLATEKAKADQMSPQENPEESTQPESEQPTTTTGPDAPEESPATLPPGSDQESRESIPQDAPSVPSPPESEQPPNE